MTNAGRMLLRVLRELDGPGSPPDTEACGKRLEVLTVQLRGGYFRPSSAPWFGTEAAANELEQLGLVKIEPVPRLATPAGSEQGSDAFVLELTPAGQRCWP